MQNTLLTRGIILIVLGLLICTRFTPSTGNFLLDVNDEKRIQDAFENIERRLSCDHLAYIGADYLDDCWLYEIILNDPGNFICTCGGENISLYSGTWTINGTIIATEKNIGLVEINPETCELKEIEGIPGFLSLSMDPTTGKLYGGWATGSSGGLCLIDLENGTLEYIGDFVNSNWIIGLAFDANGTLYGWDISPDWLYLIDKETGEATPIGTLGININYASDGHFCMEDDILYIAAFTLGPNYGSYLYECDINSGSCTLIGQFENNTEISLLAIPYPYQKNILPIAEFNWTPTLPEPGETIIFNASESNDPDGYIKLYEWDWDNDGVFDYKNYSSPIAKHIFEEKGYYPVTLRVKDNNFSNNTISKIIRVGNDPPNPPIIDGQKSGKIRVEYEYKFLVFDSNNDSMYLRIDWGNGTPEPWLGPYGSGETVRFFHSWNEKGNYTIQGQSKDIYGKESNWATLEVTMPKAYNPIWWLNNLLDRFPLLQRLLGWFIW